MQITSWNINGESQKSNIVSYYVATVPSAPALPVEENIYLVNGYEQEEAAIQVKWVAPASNGAPITGYRVEMAEDAGEFKLIYDGSGRSDILSHTQQQGITKSSYYKFKVQALNAVGSSPFSPVLTTFAAVVPTTP